MTSISEGKNILSIFLKENKIRPKTLFSDQDILQIINLVILYYFLNEFFWDYIFGFRDEIFSLNEK